MAMTLPRQRVRLPVIAGLVLAVLAGCGTRATAADGANASASTLASPTQRPATTTTAQNTTPFTEVSASGLLNSENDWVFKPLSSPAGISFDQAIAAARAEGIHTEGWSQGVTPTVALVSLTSNVGTGGSDTVTDRPAIIVQLSPVTLGYSASAATTKPLTQRSVLQIAIDANKGTYIIARSFAAPTE